MCKLKGRVRVGGHGSYAIPSSLLDGLVCYLMSIGEKIEPPPPMPPKLNMGTSALSVKTPEPPGVAGHVPPVPMPHTHENPPETPGHVEAKVGDLTFRFPAERHEAVLAALYRVLDSQPYTVTIGNQPEDTTAYADPSLLTPPVEPKPLLMWRKDEDGNWVVHFEVVIQAVSPGHQQQLAQARKDALEEAAKRFDEKGHNSWASGPAIARQLREMIASEENPAP